MTLEKMQQRILAVQRRLAAGDPPVFLEEWLRMVIRSKFLYSLETVHLTDSLRKIEDGFMTVHDGRCIGYMVGL